MVIKSMAEINKLNTAKIIFVISILTCVFWCLGQFVNVYDFAIIGAIFELAWLPMIVLLFALPLISLIYWTKEKFNLKSLHLYSFLMLLATALFLISRN